VRTQGVRAYAEVWLYREQAIRLHARYLRAMNEVLEIARLPLEEQAPRYQAWRKVYGSIDNVGGGFGLDGRPESSLLLGHAKLRCARVALAAERYRQKHGNWPQSLADLAPQYVPAVPLDPFDGKPLRYRRTDRGAVVYSVGEDGRGDGSDPDTLRGVVFKLWNVDQRRQPALPVPKPVEAPGRVP
jgi:hypothetical protein